MEKTTGFRFVARGIPSTVSEERIATDLNKFRGRYLNFHLYEQPTLPDRIQINKVSWKRLYIQFATKAEALMFFFPVKKKTRTSKQASKNNDIEEKKQNKKKRVKRTIRAPESASCLYTSGFQPNKECTHRNRNNIYSSCSTFFFFFFFKKKDPDYLEFVKKREEIEKYGACQTEPNSTTKKISNEPAKAVSSLIQLLLAKDEPSSQTGKIMTKEELMQSEKLKREKKKTTSKQSLSEHGQDVVPPTDSTFSAFFPKVQITVPDDMDTDQQL
ncbi:hypothetical protein RFI_28932 [Reticulomyxa filosa]|uniref:Uncharacterized protein n=1 Tax=Reticulomyxa filosa TaxID=46433 RepID=X6M4B4_RETFI|nr:hypothetical protein RFI_28932 [Reticulomyxa filosa]|eukprot:ETO08456.1 hypothetical protein RFI_28932 [Reticulomyxa filosa]